MLFRRLVHAIAVLFSFYAAPVAAESGISLSGELGLVSDYRFRGLSLSDRGPALQGGLTVEHASGAYAGIWSSTIEESDGGANAEVDFYAGYAAELPGGFTVDVLLNYYSYPSDGALNYAEAMATFSRTVGTATPKLGLAWAPAQGALVDEDGRERGNIYGFAALDVAIPSTPVTISAQLGHESGPFDGRSGGGKWDWQVGGTAVVGPATLGLSYVDCDLPGPGDGSGNLAAPTVVASLLLSF
jgi:uncharacterized protein (TIGR02001 family)